MRGTRTFCHRGSKFEFLYFFSIDEGREYQNTTISGPSSAASETPFKWRFAGVTMMTQQLMLAW